MLYLTQLLLVVGEFLGSIWIEQYILHKNINPPPKKKKTDFLPNVLEYGLISTNCAYIFSWSVADFQLEYQCINSFTLCQKYLLRHTHSTFLAYVWLVRFQYNRKHKVSSDVSFMRGPHPLMSLPSQQSLLSLWSRIVRFWMQFSPLLGSHPKLIALGLLQKVVH